MRKIILAAVVVCLSACGGEYRIPDEILKNQVKEYQQILYSPSGGFWSDGGMVEDRIVFIKNYSKGSGGYSEYVSAFGMSLDEFASNFEFLYKDRLIGYNSANFKFYDVVWQDGYFLPVELSFREVQKLFPELEVIKLSSAENNVLKVTKLPWETKSFLIYNDTGKDYYKYQFKPELKSVWPFNSMLTADSYGEYVYSHFGSTDPMFPRLTVKVSLF